MPAQNSTLFWKNSCAARVRALSDDAWIKSEAIHPRKKMEARYLNWLVLHQMNDVYWFGHDFPQGLQQVA